MFKKVHNIIKKFQDIQEHDFVTGKTVEQKLNHIQSLAENPNHLDVLSTYLYDRNKQIRDVTAKALLRAEWEPKSYTSRNIFIVSNQRWEKLSTIPVKSLIQEWEKNTSLTLGGFWATYLISTLYEIGKPILDQLFDIAKDTNLTLNGRSIALRCIGLLGNSVHNEPLKLLYYQEDNQMIKLAVLDALRFIGEPAITVLVEILANENTMEELSSAAARGLGSMGQAPVESLLPLMNSTHRLVREYASISLLCTADSYGISKLYDFKQSQQDGGLKSIINQFLTGLVNESYDWSCLRNQKSAAQILRPQKYIEQLNSTDEDILKTIYVISLGNLSESKAIKSLFEAAINTSNDIIQAEALMSIAKIKNHDEKRKYLFRALYHGDNFIRFWACLALLNLNISVISWL